MSSKLPDDLLSAFLDREVTPDEEVLVRKHLQKSPQARQEFQDYQRLGQLLHELPRRTAPTEFAAAVMQQAERETLIPLEASAALPSDSQSVRPFRRAWIVSLVGVAATAAAVLIVVNLPARKDIVAVREKSELPAMKADSLNLAKLPGQKAEADVKVVSAKPDGPFRARRAAGLAKPAASPQPAAPLASVARFSIADPARPAALTDKSAEKSADKSRMVFPAELKSAQEGDVVEALESVGDQVAVVRLTLVNRTASLGGLQNVLVRDASRLVRGKEKEQLMKDRFAERKASVVLDAKTVSNGPGELICVFVEGSRDELVGVLKDVQNQSQVQRAQLTNTISAEKLAEYAQRPVTAPNQPSRQALSLPHAAVDKITGATTALTDDEKKSPSASPESANDLAGLVQSMTTSDSPQKKRLASGQSVPAMNDQRGALKGKQLVAGSTQRSYQVFFVLDDQSVTESQAKPAAEAPQTPAVKSHTRPRTPVRARRPMKKRVVKPDDEAN